MKIPLKFLPILIIPAFMVQTSCSDAEIEDLPPYTPTPTPGCKLSGDVVAQQMGMELDVVLRDFPVDHYGFEMFDSDKNTYGDCAGSNPSQANAQARISSNGICVSNGQYVPCSGTISQSGGTGGNWDYSNQLMYGEYAESNTCPKVNGKNKRGYKNGPDIEPGCSDGAWQNPVFVTKGMVQETLDYSQCEGRWIGALSDPEHIRGRYCARPMPGNGACYGGNLDEWFTDGGAARRFEDVMILDRVGSTNMYSIKFDYNKVNPDWGDRGYFPLDSKEGTYGKQSLSIWCGANYPDDVCRNETGVNYWRNEATALSYVNSGKVSPNLLHNYGFTMAGSAEFKYDINADDVLEFVSNGDMWVFIDGNLAVDLGGTHIAAPAKVNIKNYGSERGWEDGSMHAINFFYANRQTEGSDLMIKISITDQTSSQFPPTVDPCL